MRPHQFLLIAVLPLRRKMLLALVMSFSLQLVQPAYAQALLFPATTKQAVNDEYHGVKVSEDYRWLEDINDPAVRRWIAEQNQFSSSILEKIPARTTIANRLKEIIGNQRSVSYRNFYQRKMFFALKTQPPKNQPFLVMLKSPEQLGHSRGTGLSERMAQAADVLAFLFDQLKMDAKALSP